MHQKSLAAIVAVAVALAGVVTGAKWLTVAALVLWGAAMLFFGFGSRGSGPSGPESD